MFSKILLVVAALAVAWTVGVWWVTVGLEKPSYTVRRTYSGFEVRKVEAFSTISATGPLETTEMNRQFMTLFNYIDGANTTATDTSLLPASIQQGKDGQKIAMTIPVLETRDSATATLSFVVPAETVRNGAPTPLSANVRVTKNKERSYVVKTLWGPVWKGRLENAKIALLDSMREEGIPPEPGTAPTVAYYNPPFSPPWMMKTEVWVPVTTLPL
jgi:SOUL heme-binding protein